MSLLFYLADYGWFFLGVPRIKKATPVVEWLVGCVVEPVEPSLLKTGWLRTGVPVYGLYCLVEIPYNPYGWFTTESPGKQGGLKKWFYPIWGGINQEGFWIKLNWGCKLPQKVCSEQVATSSHQNDDSSGGVAGFW